MSDSEVKGKGVADDHDAAQDEEFVPDEAGEDGASGEAQEPDPEDVKEVLADDEVDNEEPAEANEDQQAEVDEVYDSGGDLNEDIESEVSVEDEDDDDKDKPRGTKREYEDDPEATPNKKQKESADKNGEADKPETNGAEGEGKVGSKHDEPRDPETQGSAERLPEVGQQVEWKALPGFVDGEVVEILREEKEVDGKSVKASEDDPRLVLKSNKSGKICVHKPEAVYFK
ncbi:hypothetical protein KVR01_012002 [Diaporthe batatas]|uniref:uncharacterized protein n=1 Tax=Diaporthe batatas TaxID=748121 RepID=UPI001D03B3E9|nr:uncharacterized protein KVR01_012002 [Diaporthe batatas]KAG8158241.1 hypothetical protein KVR01_012002 [Diaporthe batatas]